MAVTTQNLTFNTSIVIPAGVGNISGVVPTLGGLAPSLGGLKPKGTWDATSNTPVITSGVGTEGDYFVVTIGGNTTVDGISTWAANDWIIYSGTQWRKLGGGISVGLDVKEVLPVLANGQTVFTLSAIPENVNVTQLMVNGMKQAYGTDYTIAGTTLTWLNANFSLTTSDTLEVYY